MDIQVQVLSTTQTAKQNAKGGTYQELEVAYKDLTNGGKVASRKVMDFAAKEAFQTLLLAKPGEVYDISMIKKGDYWNWTSAKKGSSAHTASPSASSRGASGAAMPATKGGWETPEERAKKQVYIIRQSSLSTAVAALTAVGKTVPSAEEVIDYAKQLESYVFATGESIQEGAKDSGLIEDITEDVPW